MAYLGSPIRRLLIALLHSALLSCFGDRRDHVYQGNQSDRVDCGDQGYQGEQGTQGEQGDQDKVFTTILGMLESSGFLKYKTAIFGHFVANIVQFLPCWSVGWSLWHLPTVCYGLVAKYIWFFCTPKEIQPQYLSGISLLGALCRKMGIDVSHTILQSQ